MFQNHELRQRADLAGPGVFLIIGVSPRSIILIIKLQTWVLISRLLLLWIIILRLVIL